MNRIYFSVLLLYIFSVLVVYTASVSYATADDFNMEEVGMQMSDGLPPQANDTAVERSADGIAKANEHRQQQKDGLDRAQEAREQGLDHARQALQAAMDRAHKAAERARQAIEDAMNNKPEIPTPPKDDD